MDNKLEIALKWIISILDNLKINYKIAGGFAVNIYGSKRPTADIDIDIDESNMDIVLPYIKDYIIFGPAQYKDNEWDIKLITLNYKGQEIDLCGAYETKIYNKNIGKWELLGSDFVNTEIHNVFGINVRVSSPIELLNYKSKILREVDIKDIQVLNEYIQQSK